VEFRFNRQIFGPPDINWPVLPPLLIWRCHFSVPIHFERRRREAPALTTLQSVTLPYKCRRSPPRTDYRPLMLTISTKRVCVSPSQRISLYDCHYKCDLMLWHWTATKWRDVFSGETSDFSFIDATRSRDSSVSIETGLRSGRPGFNSWRDQRTGFSFSWPLRPDRLWCPPSLLSSGYWGLFPGGKATGAWSLQLTSI
jgi:hypothetical protein